MSFKRLCDVDDFLDAGLFNAVQPQLEIRLGFGKGRASEDRLEVLAQLPGGANLEVCFLDGLEDFVLFLRTVLWVFQERIATVFKLLRMRFHFPPTHSVDRFIDLLDQVKPIMNQLRFREEFLYNIAVCPPHIQRHGLHLGSDLFGDNPLYKGPCAVFVPSLCQIDDRPLASITHNRRILSTSLERLLVHAHILKCLDRSAPQTPFHTAMHHPIDQPESAPKQLRRLRLILRGFQGVNRVAGKPMREPI